MAHDRDAPIEISGEKARQGEIVLRKRWQRVVFISGFIGIIVVIVVAQLIARH